MGRKKMSELSRDLSNIRELAMDLAGVDSIHPGQRPSPARALADFLGCSVSNAWGLLNGTRKPNPQMKKMIAGRLFFSIDSI
jgi:hypothetical protein